MDSRQPDDPPSAADVHEAAARIRAYAHRTPIFRSSSIDTLLGTEAFFKCENLQKAGAFKFRGACNAVLSLDPKAAARGVATHSSGNHAAALALAARLRGVRSTVVMPGDASRAKQAAVSAYGARIVFCEPGLASRERVLEEVLTETGSVMIHPYDDRQVIAGQGTAAMELLEEVPDLDCLLVPVGGGGLISGTALVAAEMAPSVAVVGAEPRNVDDAYRSLQAGRIVVPAASPTIADGLRATLGSLTFPILRKHVRQVVPVTEEGIVHAMRLTWERTKLVVEPSAAVALSALLEGDLPLAGRRVGIILSGGNVDLDALPWTQT